MADARQRAQNSENLLSEVHGGVLVLTINRLNQYNAWAGLRDELAAKLVSADADTSIIAAILTGAGDRASVRDRISRNCRPLAMAWELGHAWAAWRLLRCGQAVSEAADCRN